MNAPLVSVVVLNWNSGELGAEAVASAAAQTWPAVEIVVVDNASTDDSLDRILGHHDDVTVVRNDTNLAFAQGMNSGIAVANGAFVLPLNCDATLDADYVETLMGVRAREPRAREDAHVALRREWGFPVGSPMLPALPGRSQRPSPGDPGTAYVYRVNL